MATLVLQMAGSAIGGAIGGPFGAMAGRAIGAIAGATIDSALLNRGAGARHVEGPRLTDMHGLSSTEGAAIPRVYGRARLGGEVIWATRFEEEVTTTVERAGRSGGKGSAKGAKTVTTTYSYFANVAIAICEGPISFVRRIWADGQELDWSKAQIRIYSGDESQLADPLILAKEGYAPGYRGVAYIVFERLPLTDFSNRIPQFSFEVVRRLNGAADLVRAVTLIPAATEFGYDPQRRSQELSPGVTRPENRNQLHHNTDIDAAIDQMLVLLPALRRVSLVVSWFGTDLRAGECRVEPRVERVAKTVDGAPWSVCGLTRLTAHAVSTVNDRPAYGGTPSDATVIAAIQALKARGLEVVLYPFVMMDVPAGNGLSDPYGRAEQPPYPWRGRVTCHPAPGHASTPDGTATAAAQVANFVGTIVPSDLGGVAGDITCAKPDEWSFRRLVMHCARLANEAGGVDGFVIGSELIGLTRVRDAAGHYPMVSALVGIADDVRSILGSSAKLTYAADWTEYGAHVMGGGAEVRFPLDPLWASSNIDAIGIDWYPPLTDWRDGGSHADAGLARSANDIAYLRQGLISGEAFDWYYADAEDRAAQQRTPITDGVAGKPWIYRAKDLASWWSNTHVERSGWAETSATAYAPMAKPVWLTEIGFPAVDKSANGPNVFPDPKSVESAAPPYSTGERNDLAQLRALEASLGAFDPGSALFLPEANPYSAGIGRRMIDPHDVFVWTWDARPFPAFPDLDSVWADGQNWDAGHWITGRVEGAALDRLIPAVLADFELGSAVIDHVDGFLDGYVLDRPMSAREALEPLANSYGFDAVLGTQARFSGRDGQIAAALTDDDLVLDRDGRPYELRRMQESELPRELRLGYIDSETEYRTGAVRSRRLSGQSKRELSSSTAIVTRRAEAQRLADIRLQESWSARETASFEVSPRLVGLEPGDIVSLPVTGGDRLFRITRIADGPTRRVEAHLAEPAIYAAPAGRSQRPKRTPPKLPGRPQLVAFDAPAPNGDPATLQALAVFADPWAGGYALSRSDGEGAPFRRIGDVAQKALIGKSLNSFGSGQFWRWDVINTLEVAFSSDPPASVDDMAALAGANQFAILGADGQWEVFTAAHAELIGERTVRLSRLLRGLAGTEAMAARAVPAGATVLAMDEAMVPAAEDPALIGRMLRYRVTPFGYDAGDPSVAELSATATPNALRPRAPVNPRARRTPDGVAISWIRQTRQGGDAWEPMEVPLGEEVESYALDILSGSTIKRSLTTGSSAWLYPNADEVADFGVAQTQLALSIRQISATMGEGAALTATVVIA